MNRRTKQFTVAVQSLEQRTLMSASVSFSVLDLGASIDGRAINDAAQLAGANPGAATFVKNAKGKYGPRSLVPVGTKAKDTFASSINSAGVVGGSLKYATDPTHEHGTAWFPGKKGRYTPIEIQPFKQGTSFVADVNDLNQVVGSATPALSAPGDDDDHAILATIKKGKVTRVDLNAFINTTQYTLLSADAINNRSLIVGFAEKAGDDSDATAYSIKLTKGGGAAFRALPHLSAAEHFSAASDVNDAGVIVGFSTNSGFDDRPVRWVTNKAGAVSVQDLGTLGGDGGSAAAINEKGWIVGRSNYTKSNGEEHGTLWIPGKNGKFTTVDLNSFNPHKGNLTITAANGINESGQVVATGQDKQGKTHTLVLTPGKTPAEVTPAIVARTTPFATMKVTEEAVWG